MDQDQLDLVFLWVICFIIFFSALILAIAATYGNPHAEDKYSKAEQVCDKLNMEFADEPRNVPNYYCINKTSAVEIIYAEGRWRIVR